MTVYSFKSSGTRIQPSSSTQASASSPLPIGIKTPIQLGESGEGIFVMTYDLVDQVADNLRNLVQTNWGERLAFYDYGANLGPITTELVSQDDFDAEAISRINSAVAKWMPYVELVTFESKINHDENSGRGPASIDIKISYNIPSVQTTGKEVVVTLYAV